MRGVVPDGPPFRGQSSHHSEPELSALRSENRRLQAELAAARAQTATAKVESTRLATELATERAVSARFLRERDEVLTGKSARQHLVLSGYLGDYTSEFLDAKTASQRAALLEAIRSTTNIIWNSGAGLTWAVTVQVIRTMMAQHGFVFREPGEGQTGWTGYATIVPDISAVEQLDRVVRTHRAQLGSTGWYLNELTAVLLRVAKYLENNP